MGLDLFAKGKGGCCARFFTSLSAQWCVNCAYKKAQVTEGCLGFAVIA